MSNASKVILCPHRRTPSASALLASSAQAFFVGSSQFRLAVLEAGEYAMATSALALQRSRSASVRSFAQAEMAEQTAVAASLGGRPGEVALRADRVAAIQQLSAASGRSFDALYLRGQLAGHQELFQINRSYRR
jgi:putative membrane protein